MNEKEQICYPYAYGRLNSGLDMLANNLQRECMKKDIEIDDKVVDMLQEMIKDLQEKAVVESYEYV
jgi:protoporphyrinogen oxidase